MGWSVSQVVRDQVQETSLAIREDRVGFGLTGYTVEFCPSVDDRGRAWLYLGIALLSIIVWLVGQWAVATYDPWDYGASMLVGLLILAFEILGLYGAFRFYQARHPQ
jgi:hypothetical protein